MRFSFGGRGGRGRDVLPDLTESFSIGGGGGGDWETVGEFRSSSRGRTSGIAAGGGKVSTGKQRAGR